MKKWLIALLTLLALSLSVAFAAEANDITEDCKFKVCSSGRKYTLMTDKKYTSYWESNKIKTPWIAITAPEGKPIAGLYVCFGNMPESWEIQTSDDGKDWFTAVPGDTRFLHAYVALPQPAQHVRLAVTSEKKTALRINDLFVLSEGDLPDWVQVWQPTEEKADILFLSTHPDDELIFFGGAIPTYAVEQQRKVVVAYFTRSNTTRSSELLNGLWHMGVRTYPVIGNFKDSYAKNLKAAYKSAGGKGKVNEWIVGLYRQYKPEVVVTQDTNGEYGHKQHMMIADAAQNCIALAANEDEFTASTIAYGTWQVKKLYLHLYPENQITFDWTVPLKSMNGATGIELAEEAYTLHKTQASSGMSVTETGTKYDNRVFGLAFTTVGEDVRKDDFLENIYDAPGSYDAAANNVEATPAPTEVPAYMAHMPALNAKGFLDEGEYIYSSEDEGLWIYVSQTSKVIIQRKYDATQPLTWFEADLYGDLDAGEMLRTVQNDPEKMGKVRVDVMVLDLIMPQMDGFALMEEVRRQQLANPPQIIVVSALGRDDFIMRAVQLGARFYMVKPFDMASLAARIRESCGQGVVPLGTTLNASARSLSIDEKLASLFLTIGIPAHIKGYQFLRTAVKMVVDNPDMINRITKELYPSIGKCYNTSASKVERAIRHAIEVAWSRGRIDTLNKAFGCRVATKEDKPTNGEFIAMLADKLSLEQRSAS